VNERLGEQRALTTALNEQVDSLSVSVSNADGSVRVQVDGWGALTGLWMHERAYRDGADALAVQIVEIAQAAAKVVADRQAFLLNEFGKRAQRIHEETE
jgi:YbaB/EbfC DNA-binding family